MKAANWKIKVYKRSNCNSEFKYTGITYIVDTVDLCPNDSQFEVFDDHVYKYVFLSNDEEMVWWTSNEEEMSGMGYESYIEVAEN